MTMRYNSKQLGWQLLVLFITGSLLGATGVARADALRAQAGSVATRATGETGAVRGDRVNVRARPDTKAEVVAQLNKGDVVTILGREGAGQEEWLRIAMPASAKCYVSAKLIADGVVTGDKVNVRCGPGTNFRDVGKVAKGERLQVIKTEGEWAQIKPTAGCSAWVAAQFVEITVAPPPAPSVPATEIVPPPVPLVSPQPAPPTVELVNVQPDVIVSVVTKSGFLKVVAEPVKAPAAYELMTAEVGGLAHRIAYLESPDQSLAKFVGKEVRVIGNQRWRKGDREPVIVAERVERIW